MSKLAKLAAFGVALGVLLSPLAKAQDVTFKYTATVSSVDGGVLASLFPVGTAFSGDFTIDYGAVGVKSGSNSTYKHGLVASHTDLGSVSIDVNDGEVSVQPSPASQVFGLIAGKSYGNIGYVSVAGLKDWTASDFDLFLKGGAPGLINSFSIPSVSVLTDVSEFSSATIGFILNDSNGAHAVQGKIKSVEVAALAVPEPEEYLLFALGGMVVAHMARRRNSKSAVTQ